MFRGRSPTRTDVTSISRVWTRGRPEWLAAGAWQAQFSGGRLHEPEWLSRHVTRLTASVAFAGTVWSRPLAATLAWGENRQDVVANGVSDGFLVEWDCRSTTRWPTYGRAEITNKELLGLGFHPKGFAHPHIDSHVDVRHARG